MSQDQATQSKTTNQDSGQERTNPTQRNQSIHDPMTSEEIRSSFQESVESIGRDASSSKDTSTFRMGLAQAFAQEEKIQEEHSYAPPKQLERVRSFMSSFDFTDKNNPVQRFEIVSSMHQEIIDVQTVLQQIKDQFALSFKARQQLLDDLYLLDTFRKQTFDFIEETRPTY